MDKARATSMIWGSFVADAATMGLHWLYDQARIRQAAPEKPEFLAPLAANFEGVPSYFAHPTRKSGDFSQYGEQQLVMLQSLAAVGAYDRADYQTRFQTHFGYGGAFVGFIDRPTRGTLDALASMADGATTYPGADDTQLPALSKLPVLVVRHAADANLMNIVEDAVRVTNNNNTAVAFAKTATLLLKEVLQTGMLPDLREVIAAADPIVKTAISGALDRTNETTEAVTGDIGMACNLDLGVPSLFHNLATQTSFEGGVRANIYAGGDNCGRSIVLGAVLGALYSVPQEWMDRVTRREAVSKGIAALL